MLVVKLLIDSCMGKCINVQWKIVLIAKSAKVLANGVGCDSASLVNTSTRPRPLYMVNHNVSKLGPSKKMLPWVENRQA